MKQRKIMICLALLASLAGLLALHSGLQLANDARAAGPLTGRLNFDMGIGFYTLNHGQLVWLDYPTFDHEKVQQECIPVARSDFRLFVYGIDYAKTPSGLPPHLNDFGIFLHDASFNIDSPDFKNRDPQLRQGPYAVHFIPLAGYDQPVYEITCDLWAGLRKKDAPPVLWGLRVKDGVSNNVPPAIYWFSFKDDTPGA